jgi:ABC-type transporter Mla subunit MlaD
MDDIDKLNKRRLELEAADKAKTDEWTATSGKMQAEFEATKAELAKAQEQIARFQGSAQDAAKNKRPSSEMVKPAAQPAAQPVAQPAMPWTQSLQAIEVKQSNPFVSDLWGHNRQGTAKESAEIFQFTIQEGLARMPK